MSRLFFLLALLMSPDLCWPQGSQQFQVVPLSRMRHLQAQYPYNGYRPALDVAGYCLLDRPQKLDVSRLCVIYDVDILVDTLSDKRLKDCMVTLIGDTYYKSYGRCCWQVCMNHTDRTLRRSKDFAWMDAYDGVVLNMAVYRNRATRRMMQRGLFPLIDQLVFEYTESEPPMNWVLSGQTRTLEGYTCQRAVCRYAGREWAVWFTTAVPVDCGLWKFNGLPGLILEARDLRGHYHFRVNTVESHEEEIVRYRTATKKLTRSEYLKRERTLYSAPLFHAQGPDSYFLKCYESGAMEFVTADDFVDLPYNPLELE